MLGEGDDVDNKVKMAHRTDPELFKRLVSEGVPTEYRWQAWKECLNVDHMVDKKKYKELLKKAEQFDEENDPIMRQIICDVDRTYTWFPYFDKNIQKTGLEKLKRCLQAFAMYNDEIGYTQSMNYLMGFILLVSGGNELESFWFFVALTEGNDSHFHPGIDQFYTEGFPLYYQFVEHFDYMFECELPNLK